MAILYNPRKTFSELKLNTSRTSQIIISLIIIAHLVYLVIFDAVFRNAIESWFLWPGMALVFISMIYLNIPLDGGASDAGRQQFISLHDGSLYCKACNMLVDENDLATSHARLCPQCSNELVLRSEIDENQEDIDPELVIAADGKYYLISLIFPLAVYLAGYNYFLFFFVTLMYESVDEAMGGFGTFIVNIFLILLAYGFGIIWTLITISASTKFVEFYPDFFVAKRMFRNHHISWDQIKKVYFYYKFDKDRPWKIVLSSDRYDRVTFSMKGFNQLNKDIYYGMTPYLEKFEIEYESYYSTGRRSRSSSW